MPGSYSLSVAEDRDGLEACWVVWSDWGDDYKQFDSTWSFDSKRVFHGDTSWSKVQRVHRLVWQPVFLNFDEFDNTVEEFLVVKSRES